MITDIQNIQNAITYRQPNIVKRCLKCSIEFGNVINVVEYISLAVQSGNLEIIYLLFDHFEKHQLSEYEANPQHLEAIKLRNEMAFDIESGLNLIKSQSDKIEELKPVLSEFYASVLLRDFNYFDEDDAEQKERDNTTLSEEHDSDGHGEHDASTALPEANTTSLVGENPINNGHE